MQKLHLLVGCDLDLKLAWIAACKDEYSGDAWVNITSEKSCKWSCIEIARAMSKIQSNALEAAEKTWNAAETTRSLSENRKPTRQLLLHCSTYVHPCTSAEKLILARFSDFFR